MAFTNKKVINKPALTLIVFPHFIVIFDTNETKMHFITFVCSVQVLLYGPLEIEQSGRKEVINKNQPMFSGKYYHVFILL